MPSYTNNMTIVSHVTIDSVTSLRTIYHVAFTAVLTTYIRCLKNDTGVAHYNFNVRQPILVISGRDVAETACYRKVIYIPSSPD